MEWPVLNAIVDVAVCRRAGWDPIDYASALLDGGATFLQLRAKELTSSAILAVSDAVMARAESYQAAVIINDRADVAMLSGASGVHVGQDDLSVDDVRAIVGPKRIVGLSTHTPPQIQAALQTTASYVAVGPVFGTETKDTGYDSVGVALISLARRATDRPLVAIGGVTLDNATEALGAGATMVAVISDLLVGGHPSRRVSEYLERLKR